MKEPVFIECRGGNVIVTDATLDELFVAMQPTAEDRVEAAEFVKNNPIPKYFNDGKQTK
jgi:hypothetical protein